MIQVFHRQWQMTNATCVDIGVTTSRYNYSLLISTLVTGGKEWE